MSTKSVYHSTLTQLLHLFIAAAVVHQLIISLVMKHPERGSPGDAYFELHEWVGIASLAALTVFFLWAVVRRGETNLGMLFPWFSGKRLRAFWMDLKSHLSSLKAGRIPLTQESPLASAVHGVGLLLALVMATSGAAGYFIATARPLLSIHETVAPLMWAYLVGHAGLAVLHQLAGHRIFQSMFGFRAAARTEQDSLAGK
ncbi:MAG: cytochrome b/b6 domain-containing protein [Sphingomonas sp.]|uniref:cytochrome b/b6 domain-containing protein n=1 Tax=Sphingomonas sp. TaxID=28214 RepID=UPI00262D428C|nr:cytochrome b/b6 domain-containing protein [Sphingomonas sp.]MDK2767997.1 cytochrome b/b6 domain-containing protein [Sphingomonas sp.]